MMQISMDILSLVMPKADPGAGARQRAAPKARDNRFDNLLEKAFTGPDQSGTGKKSAKGIAGKDNLPAVPKKTGDSPDGNIAAAMMGNQETVVSILEGDKESATTPDVNADAAAVGAVQAPAADITDEAVNVDTIPVGAEANMNARPADDETVADKYPVNNDTNAADAINEAEKYGTTATAPEPDTQDVTGAAEQAAPVETPNALNKVKEKSVPDTEAGKPDAVQAAGGAEGEVTARMPIVRTSERQDNEGSDTEFSGNGDLSPLENENDPAPAKGQGQKEKTYAATADAVRGKTENTREPVSNPPPLAHGIKPEQFTADQEMIQITPNEPVRPENLFDEMVSRIETMQNENTQTMTIQLKPEFLGKVALEIAMDAAGLHVRINAANTDVRAMLNGQLNTLIESLGNKGIEVAEVEVTYTGVSNETFRDPREGGQARQPDRPRRSYRGGTDQIEGAAYYAALPIETLDYYVDAGVSSVEYRA